MSRATRFARGSTETGDLTENLQIYPRAANSAAESGRGCFHSGFLSRAQLFPLQERGGSSFLYQTLFLKTVTPFSFTSDRK